MAHELKRHEVTADTVEAGHEPSVVNVRVLVITGLSIVALGLFTHGLLTVMFRVFDAEQARRDAHGQLSAILAEQDLPPRDLARLQGIPGFSENTPRTDMKLFADASKARLNGYGPTTRPGVVRVPIDRAMDLALERNLFPVRPDAGVPEPKSVTPGGAHDSE